MKCTSNDDIIERADQILKKKFHITTFGCQMNEHDSETIAGMLLERGYEQ